MSLPEDIVNRAMDAAGADNPIGNMQDGSREANIALRHYGPTLRELLCAAHWNMARKQEPLVLLADATGSTQNVGTIVPAPWSYEYALPTDCIRARFVPLNNGAQSSGVPTGNIVPPNSNSPLFGAGNTPASNQTRLVPTRFLIATDPNYAPQITQGPGGTEWWEMQGISPANRTVVLTNVKSAVMIYTCLQIYPSLWDALFEGAFVAALAEKMALPISRDKKFGAQMQQRCMATAIRHIKEARVSDGNESWSTTDNIPDWIRMRSSGGGASLGGTIGDGGGYGCGWSSYFFSNGSAF